MNYIDNNDFSESLKTQIHAQTLSDAKRLYVRLQNKIRQQDDIISSLQCEHNDEQHLASMISTQNENKMFLNNLKASIILLAGDIKE